MEQFQRKKQNLFQNNTSFFNNYLITAEFPDPPGANVIKLFTAVIYEFS